MEGRSQPLSPKDAQSFQKALTLYEAKEYEKSLAEVEEILKRRKEKTHGESLCLQGLLLHHLGRDADRIENLLNEGCKVDAKSHVAWHMAGIYYKLTHNYPAAYKAYLNSFKLKQDNPNVHQDLAMLAAQNRDYATLVLVRRQILGARMSVKIAWSGLAAAQYLHKEYAGVEQTVSLWEQIMTVENASQSKSKTRQQVLTDEIEASELLMLRNQAIVAQQQYERAVADLDKIESRVRDKLAWLEVKAAALAHYDKAAAEQQYLQLLDRNPENAAYYSALEKLVPSVPGLYTKLAERYPKADMPKSRPLLILSPAELSDYAERLEAYLKEKLAREVPSTFMLVKSLYEDPHKLKAITEVVEARLGLLDKQKISLASSIFVARHLSYTGRQTQAVELLESVSLDDVDLDSRVDVQLALSELLQRAGGFKEAAATLQEASEKIPGDRYLNTKAAAAAFRANNVEDGYKLAFQFPIWGKYVKTDQEALKHIISLESVNVLILMAEAHFRLREHGLALKRAMQTIEIFETYYREQYDFHFYGPRRGTLRAYIAMVEWEDELFTHPIFKRALTVAVSEWVAFARKESDGLSEKEVSQAKRRRAQQLDSLDLEADADPFGIALLESKSGPQQALQAWQHLEAAKPADPETWWLAFKLYLAQDKYVIANQALKKAKGFGLSPSRVASGGLMARYALENDSNAPEVLRKLQFKLLPAIVAQGDIIESDPSEYAAALVPDLVDWVSVHRFMNSMQNVEAEASKRINELASIEEVEKAYLELQRAGQCDLFGQAVRKTWPKATFC